MHEILGGLHSDNRVLDLGCKGGSFDASLYPPYVVRFDLAPPAPSSHPYVIGDAAHLPFKNAAFDAVVANHSLEHFERLAKALSEIRRVIRPGGAFYCAVPDASTFSDRLYRWLSHGGGHVNAFRSQSETAKLFEQATGLRLVGVRLLLSSFSFANRNNERWSRRIALLGWGNETFLAALAYSCRVCDKLCGTRFGYYGWAFYFGAVTAPIETTVWTNVCVRCGSAHPQHSLRTTVSNWPFLPPRYSCPSCGAMNFASPDIPN